MTPVGNVKVIKFFLPISNCFPRTRLIIHLWAFSSDSKLPPNRLQLFNNADVVFSVRTFTIRQDKRLPGNIAKEVYALCIPL